MNILDFIHDEELQFQKAVSQMEAAISGVTTENPSDLTREGAAWSWDALREILTLGDGSDRDALATILPPPAAVRDMVDWHRVKPIISAAEKALEQLTLARAQTHSDPAAIYSLFVSSLRALNAAHIAIRAYISQGKGIPAGTWNLEEGRVLAKIFQTKIRPEGGCASFEEDPAGSARDLAAIATSGDAPGAEGRIPVLDAISDADARAILKEVIDDDARAMVFLVSIQRQAKNALGKLYVESPIAQVLAGIEHNAGLALAALRGEDR